MKKARGIATIPLAPAFAVAMALLAPTPGQAAVTADDGDTAACRRLVKEKWEIPRTLDLEGCLDRLAGSPSPYDENGYKLALWGDTLLASDGTGLYQSDDGGESWIVARQPADVTQAALILAPADPPPLRPAVDAPPLPAPDAAAGASQAARYRMWLTLARRCDPDLPDEGTALRDLQFKASECERTLRAPPGRASTAGD
ncbi:hypothetical protein L2U69_09235 [Zavarzinia compransoris]|uniref:hypothetical protein n=1 Tax=Zavarzinia marina TaxID=2911065 RepID=UPI001F31208C|nr:hypothetical protein [Zavarzinia marina]MCF4165825.1 hypothetical protein [Zavarzinia marina]